MLKNNNGAVSHNTLNTLRNYYIYLQNNCMGSNNMHNCIKTDGQETVTNKPIYSNRYKYHINEHIK